MRKYQSSPPLWSPYQQREGRRNRATSTVGLRLATGPGPNTGAWRPADEAMLACVRALPLNHPPPSEFVHMGGDLLAQRCDTPCAQLLTRVEPVNQHHVCAVSPCRGSTASGWPFRMLCKRRPVHGWPYPQQHMWILASPAGEPRESKGIIVDDPFIRGPASRGPPPEQEWQFIDVSNTPPSQPPTRTTTLVWRRLSFVTGSKPQSLHSLVSKVLGVVGLRGGREWLYE